MSTYRLVRHLGVATVVGLAFRHIKNRGPKATLVRIFRLMLDGAAHNSFDVHNAWLQRNSVPVAGPAPMLFSSSHIVIIGTLDLPQCRRYRVFQKAELLRSLGCSVSVCDYRDSYASLNAMQTGTSLILYRVPDGKTLKGYVNEARRLGLRVYYDIDDPIFDKDVYAKNKNLAMLSSSEKTHLLSETRNYLQAMRVADEVLVSTENMAELARSHGLVNVSVWPNVIDGALESSLKHGGADNDQRHEFGEGMTVVGYMSGSRAHDADFEEVAGVLERVLRSNPCVVLYYCGYGAVPQNLCQFSDRIYRSPFSGYKQYLGMLAKLDINIIPLVIDEFNECKSAIRFLEASLAGVPTIASAVGEFKTLIEDGVSGLLAENPEQWEAALSVLIRSPNMREELVRGARARVSTERHIDSLSPQLSEVLRKIMVDYD